MHVAAYARGRVGGRIALAALFLLAGCGAGKEAETAREVPAIPGIDADAGPVALRDLLIPYRAGGYPAGSDVPLVVRLFSEATQPVALGEVTPGTAGVMTVQASRIVLVRGTTAGRSPSPLVIQPGGYLSLVPPSTPHLVAEHISAALRYGAGVPVRFTFSSGRAVEVDVPMAAPDYAVG